MYASFEEKGKIFTDVIAKEPLRVIIQTISQRIQGLMHMRQNTRLKDEINQSERFIAVTQATVFGKDGKPLYQTEFMLVQCDHITWIIPEEDLKDRKGDQ